MSRPSTGGSPVPDDKDPTDRTTGDESSDGRQQIRTETADSAGAAAPGSTTPPPDGPPPTAANRLRRWIPTLAWSAPLFLVVITIQGLIPGTSPLPPFWSLGAGNIECIARLGWSQFFERCHQIGAPVGSPLLLGLPQTYVGAWLSYLPGIDAWRAYKIVTALCCAIGFAGAVALFRRWNAPVWLAAVGATLFLTSPTLISLATFTYTFHGYAQLPAYLWLLLRSLDAFEAGRTLRPTLVAIGTSLLIVFTDGYSFMGTAVVVLVVGLGWVLSRSIPLRVRMTGSAIWATAMVGSAGLYLVYIPSGGVDLRVGIGAFRYLGLDALTLFLPGPFLWYSGDAPWRSTLDNLWGDGSNQTTNFLGLFTVALVGVAVAFGLLRSRTAGGRERLTLALAGLACLGLAFGPAFKFANSTVPITPSYDVPLSETRMWLPTALLYEHVPGFTEIRATYRIFAVTRFALIALAIVGLAALWRTRAKWLAPALAVLVVLEGSVNPVVRVEEARHAFAVTGELRSTLLVDLQTLVRPGETILMLPASNDFYATGLVPFTGATSYNVGVDKNYYLSTAAWPSEVNDAVAAYQKGDISAAGCALLRTGAADVIVLPVVPINGDLRSASPVPALQTKADKVASAAAATGSMVIARTDSALSLRPGPSCS